MKNMCCVLGAFLVAGVAGAQTVEGLVKEQLGPLLETYKDIHAHPELSHHEERTAGIVAAELRRAGFKVTDHLGKYSDGSQAFGVVALLENGKGPRLLIRTELDALPIVEETGVPYASTVKTKNAAGQEVGVMHACGHDVHASTFIGTARVLASLRSKWHGTLMMVGQPSEETIDGARAMLADGLYQRFGTPDMAIALHDTNELAAGSVGVTSGVAMPSSSSVDVIMRGIGGHGAYPQLTKDPVVMAAEFVVQLQTIVSRRQDPRDPLIVTVGDIHGGTKRNIIPNEVRMEITARAFSDKGRQTVIDGIHQTAAGVAQANGVPENLAPIVNVLEEHAPLTYNDPALTARVRSALIGALGKEHVIDEGPGTASEDFDEFALEGRKVPAVMFSLGAMDGEELAAAHAAGKSLPGPHNSHFKPVPEPTLRAGVTAMSNVALALLK
jgi:hippurate hydrolase